MNGKFQNETCVVKHGWNTIKVILSIIEDIIKE